MKISSHLRSLRCIEAVIILAVSAATFASNLSPYGTNFALGSKEDLEIRLEWAKKDQCYKHGFAANSLEALEIKKFWTAKNGPSTQAPSCNQKKQ